MVYFTINGYKIHANFGDVNQCPQDQRGHLPEVVLLSEVVNLVKHLQVSMSLAALPPLSPCPTPGPDLHAYGTDMEDLTQHGRCGEPEYSIMQVGVTSCVGHQRGVGGGLEERPKPLDDTVAVRPYGEM